MDIGECIGESKSDAELYDQYFGFREAIETVRNGIKEIANDQTVVIIVDELDRCLPTYAIKVLERIHHIFNGLENVVVIIAMEKKQIENSLHQIYGEGMDVDQYLKKFIPFSVKLITVLPETLLQSILALWICLTFKKMMKWNRF